MLAIALETDYVFKEAAELKELMSDPTKMLALAAAAAVEEAPADAAAPAEEVGKSSSFRACVRLSVCMFAFR